MPLVNLDVTWSYLLQLMCLYSVNQIGGRENAVAKESPPVGTEGLDYHHRLECDASTSIR